MFWKSCLRRLIGLFKPTHSYRPSSHNASEISNEQHSAMPPTHNFNRGFAQHPTDALSNLSEDVNPLDERFSERSFAPSGRNQMSSTQMERSFSRNSNRQTYADAEAQGASWAANQNSFSTTNNNHNNNSPSILNNSYRPQQSLLNKSHSNNQFTFGLDPKSPKPDLAEVIAFLSNQSDAIKANAAAYLQHLSYMDDNVKVQTRVLRGIPPLLNLVNHELPEVHRAACGALRNLSYGRANDDNKREIKDNNGITVLLRLIRRTPDQETLELVTGIIWNLSSCAELKKPIIDEGLKTLLDQVVIPLSRMAAEQKNFPSYRSVVFRNASGVFRNVSSDGDYARKKMRECDGLIGSLIGVIQQSLTNEDCDNKSIENCVCILRNLSYACQEVSDPDYLRKNMYNIDNKDPKTGCFGNKSKSTNKQKSSNISLMPIFDHSKQTNAKEMSKLWSPDILDIYLPLLNYCTNPDTLEAIAGAIQNLVACDWQPSKDLREAMRNRKGIEIIIKLIEDSHDKVICASARSLRNLALDDKCRDLIGKRSIRTLVDKLPSPSEPSKFQLSNDTLLAIQSTLYEVIKSNSAFARVFVDVKGVNKLMNISKSPPGVFDDKVVRYSRQLLQKIWKYGDLHDELRKNGWDQNDFIITTPTVTGGRSSAENTINRPIMSQGRSQMDNSFRRPAHNNGDLYNQNALALDSPNYSLSHRIDEEVPLDSLHAMQLSDRLRGSRENFNNNIQNSLPLNNYLQNSSPLSPYDNSQSRETFRGSQSQEIFWGGQPQEIFQGSQSHEILQGDLRSNDPYGISRARQGGYFGPQQMEFNNGTREQGAFNNGPTEQGAFNNGPRGQGAYWMPGDSDTGTVKTSNNLGSSDQLYPKPQPRNHNNNDSWV